MNDRELLEKAARAVDHEYDDMTECWSRDGIEWEQWNPLEDDGDAFRLAVKLAMIVKIYRNRVMIEDVYEIDDCEEEQEVDIVYRNIFNEEPWTFEAAQAATRRAITRAAAALADND